jgi:hypothetical protein
MKHVCSMFRAGPRGWIAIVHVPLEEFMDSERAAWRRSTVSELLGGMDVLLRYASATEPPLIEGDPLLCHFGDDSTIDALPVFELQGARRLRVVA